ncbi:hypothetical protein [Legionella gresilensis]|uniref:hypothetical protein n=1 Tax=Legionella gresilensis TaxID=91823 RepID=UPI0010414340|nr:hypothetical protein [Legionella gresilensis]
MDLLIVTVIILGSAILVFFSAEFGNMIKKIMAIPGVKLLLPLTLVSWFIISSEAWILWGLLFVKIGLHTAVSWLAKIMPFPGWKERLATFFVIYLITLIPLSIIYWRKKKRPFFYKSSYWIITALIWVFLLITLTVGFY